MAKPAKWILFFASVLLFASCVTEDKFLYLSKKIDAIEAKTDKELLSNSDRMAANVADMESLKQQMRSLNGRLDENSHLLKKSIERDSTERGEGLSDLQKRMTRLESRVDRISSYLGLEPLIESNKQSAPAAPMAVPQFQRPSKPADQPKPEIPADRALYDENMNLYHKEKYEEAIAGFRNFLQKFPKSKLADNAAFWIGESHMALNQHEQAILAFQKVIKKYPKGNKVPNALLRQSLAFYELNDKTSARLLLAKIIKQYPKSNEAKIARKKLKTLK